MARRRTRSIFHTAATVRTAAEPGFNEEGGVDTGWGDLTYLVPNPDDFPDGPTMEEWLDSLPADQKMVLPESWLDAQASRSAELRQREAAILQAMGKATLPEQRQLLGELNAIRTERTAMVQASRDIDLANATISDHLTPVASLGARSSAKSDWLAEVPTYTPGDLTHTMVAEASLFFRALHPAVKADAEELVIQSLGKARQVASQFERQSRVAVEAFMDEIVRLAEAQPAAEPAEDGAAESSLPVAVNPSDAPETFDTDTLSDQGVSDSQMADSDFAQKYQSSRSTAATLAAMNDTMWARLGAADDEPWADDDTDDTDTEDTADEDADEAEDTGGETEEEDEDEDDNDSPFPKESVRKTASCELPAGTTLMVRFKAMTEVREIAKSAARRTAVSLTNVGLDGENGIGTDPQGNRVRFKLSPQDRKDLSSVLFSDMAVNFTGVDVEESDIIRSASRRTASGDYCPKCGSSESTMQASGTQKCNSCGHEHLQYQRTDKKSARRTASVVDTLRQIVEQKQYQDVNGMTVDAYSASAILGVLDALNPENQAMFTKIIESDVAKAADVAFKLVNKSAAKTAAAPAGEYEKVKAFVSETWDGLYTSNFSEELPDGSRLWRSTLHNVGGPTVWTQVTPDGSMVDMTRTASRRSAAEQVTRDPNYPAKRMDWGDGDGACSRRTAAKEGDTCEVCGKALTSGEIAKLNQDIDFVEHSGHTIRVAPKTASRRTAADEPSESGAAESTLPVAVNPSDAPEGLDQLTDGSGDAPSGAAAGSPTTFADFVADRSKLSSFRQRVQATQAPRGRHPFVREAMPNPADMGVKVGDIFDAQWGYDQTNVDFYEVVGLTGASVKVRPIDKKTHGTPTQWAVRQVMPIPGAYIGGVMTKRIQDYSDRPSFNVDASSSAYLWDGKPITETSYA